MKWAGGQKWKAYTVFMFGNKVKIGKYAAESKNNGALMQFRSTYPDLGRALYDLNPESKVRPVWGAVNHCRK